jgi:hypothetical protein
VRFAFFDEGPVARRSRFRARLDGADLGEGITDAMLAPQGAYFVPGSTKKWRELAPGEHKVTLEATSFRRHCDDPECTEFGDEGFPADRSMTFTVDAGSYWTIVGMHRVFDLDAPMGSAFPSPETASSRSRVVRTAPTSS